MDRYDPYTDKFIKAQPHTYRGVTLNDVMMYFDSLAENEDAWTEFCSCFECRGWGLYHIQSATDKTDARQDFMDIVYSELESDPDNNRANRIIWAADGYAERRVDDALQVLQSAQLGTNLAEVGTDTISRQAAIDALTKDKEALEHSINGMSGYEKEFDRFVGQRNQVDCDIYAIEQLPPAQPEIIHCKDCVKHNKDVGDLEVLPDGKRSWIWKDQACPLVSWRDKAQGHEFDYQYCAYAERRTDG